MTSAGLMALLFAATPMTWGLTWKAPPECIQPVELVEGVEERLGRPVFGADPEFRIDGLLKPGNPGWKAKLALLDKHGAVQGSRAVSTGEFDCRSMDPSLVLVVAMMIDPLASGGSTASMADDPPPVPEAPPFQPPPPPAQPLVSPPVERLQSWWGVTGGLGPAPAPALGLLFSIQQSLGPGWFLDYRFPLYPFVPVWGAQVGGGLVGMGMGLGVGLRQQEAPSPRWSWLGSLALEGHGFLVASSARPDLVGRVDLMARGGLGRTVGGWRLSLQLEAGASPWVPVIRLVTSDGKPDDVGLGFPFRLGVAVAVAWLAG